VESYIIEKIYFFLESSYREIISRYTQFFILEGSQIGKTLFLEDIKRSKRDEKVYKIRARMEEIFFAQED
jgi:hypothetical protein